MKIYPYHPYADIFPQMIPEEYDAFLADVEANGVRNPLTLYQGKILDGRHRQQAKIDLKDSKGIDIKLSCTTFDGDDAAAIRFVYSSNFYRRNLSAGQKAAIGVAIKQKLQETIKAGAPDGNRNASKNNGGNPAPIELKRNRVRDMAGAIVGVSGRSIDAAERIAEKSPQLFEAVKSGEKTIWEAEREAKAQEEAVKREEMIATARLLSPSKESGRLLLYTGDIRSAGCSVPDNSVHMIFTDPPYDEKATVLYKELAAFANRVLLPGGVCMAYSGQLHLPQVIEAMSAHLEYLWLCQITHSQGDLSFFKWRIKNAWKPVVMFGKPPVSAWWNWFRDTVSGGREKEGHKWQQAESEAAHYIERLSPEQGTVCDPFCGSGTSLAAAHRLGRTCIGIDKDGLNIDYTRQRILRDAD